MSLLAKPYKFTTEEFFRLCEKDGIFDSHDRVELLNGELIIMHAVGYRHAQAVTNLNQALAELSRRRFKVSPQNPVELDRFSAPQPDITLVPWSRARKAHPRPDEAFLVIEVSDSSLQYDRRDKLKAYARTGIQEFWILNLEQDQLEIYRRPQGDDYAEKLILPSDGVASPVAFPDVTIPVAEIIPER